MTLIYFSIFTVLVAFVCTCVLLLAIALWVVIEEWMDSRKKTYTMSANDLTDGFVRPIAKSSDEDSPNSEYEE